MKLWLLRPIEYEDGDTPDQLWIPQWDRAFGFVVRAETESEARAIAQANAGDEASERHIAWLGLSAATRAWTSAEHSTCVELVPDGQPGVVIRDFKDS